MGKVVITVLPLAAVSSCRASKLRFTARLSLPCIQGHIIGFVTDRPEGTCEIGAGLLRVHHCNAFSAPRFAVNRSILGGLIAIVLTHVTLRRGSSSRMRCWQLLGCLPQSSENTKRSCGSAADCIEETRLSWFVNGRVSKFWSSATNRAVFSVTRDCRSLVSVLSHEFHLWLFSGKPVHWQDLATQQNRDDHGH